MEFRDALKVLRKELGITQTELATALHISGMTVSRWELGKTYPNRAMVSLLLGYAYTHSAKKSTVDMLRKTIAEISKNKAKSDRGGIPAVEHSSLVELIDAAPFPIYVCDMTTDMMLYANKKALEMIGLDEIDITECKCYECIMHRDIPCEFCHKSTLLPDTFTAYTAKRPLDDRSYEVFGKLTRWNGHEAQVRCVIGSDRGENSAD